MTASARSVAAAAIVAMLLGTAGPAHAEDQPKGRSAGTVVKWTLIGVAAGAGIGFLAGFNAYDDAPYAESKIAKATVAGGAIGAGAGFGFGLWRSQPSSSPNNSARTLWRPDAKMPSRAAPAWGASRPAPTLRSLSQPWRFMP
jgi:hypothetical protein